MKITILNGDMQPNKSFTTQVNKLVSQLSNEHSIAVFNLIDEHIYSCHGCFYCWVKTPGICVLKDAAAVIHKAVINADLLIFASPLKLGFTSSVLKKITDRLIVLLHPYIKLRQGEMHHEKRYAQYPNFGIILQKEPDTDEEDILILRDIYDRIALNFHAEVQFLDFIDNKEFDIKKHLF
jgi:multimeric flavodoxin WrbA